MAEGAGKGFTGAPRAWWLSRDMARKRGLNLSEEVALGRLRKDDLGEIVSRCGQCQGGAQCAHWLAFSEPGAELPDYCPNKVMLDKLSEDVSAVGSLGEAVRLEVAPNTRQKEK